MYADQGEEDEALNYAAGEPKESCAMCGSSRWGGVRIRRRTKRGEDAYRTLCGGVMAMGGEMKELAKVTKRMS